MKLNIDTKDFRVTGKEKFKIAKAATKLKEKLFKTDEEFKARQEEFREEIAELQQKMFAHDRYGLLIIFQALDAAGKDSTIRHVMSGINPSGMEVHYFKRPSEEELDHDYLWRCQKNVPPRGRIGIFNRSYYEEVLVCRVHPDIVTKFQRMPTEATAKLDKLWERRFKEIRNFEDYLHANGIHVLKFYLHVSKKEQRERFLERIDNPAKNWKFNVGDLDERDVRDDYMAAYEEAINATATKENPWYAIPADCKKTMRLIVSKVILEHIEAMELAWPVLPKEQQALLAESRKRLMAEKTK